MFVNIAGGVRIDEPAMDLAVALAVASSFHGRPFASDAVAFGEVGLAGEVRGVARVPARLAEARTMGFAGWCCRSTSAERLTDGENARARASSWREVARKGGRPGCCNREPHRARRVAGVLRMHRSAERPMASCAEF